jgi:hypothetical protein
MKSHAYRCSRRKSRQSSQARGEFACKSSELGREAKSSNGIDIAGVRPLPTLSAAETDVNLEGLAGD